MKFMTILAAVLFVAACSGGNKSNAGTSETAAGAITPRPDTTNMTRTDTGMSRMDTSMMNDTSMHHDTSKAKSDTGSTR